MRVDHWIILWLATFLGLGKVNFCTVSTKIYSNLHPLLDKSESFKKIWQKAKTNIFKTSIKNKWILSELKWLLIFS